MTVSLPSDREYTAAVDQAYSMRGQAIWKLLSVIMSADMGQPVRRAMNMFNDQAPVVEQRFRDALGDARTALANRQAAQEQRQRAPEPEEDDF